MPDISRKSPSPNVSGECKGQFIKVHKTEADMDTHDVPVKCIEGIKSAGLLSLFYYYLFSREPMGGEGQREDIIKSAEKIDGFFRAMAIDADTCLYYFILVLSL